MNINEVVPNVSFQATTNLTAHLHDYRGQIIVLYFYPKDATPGCTSEGKNFRDAYPEFKALNVILFGISRDSIESHERFKAKQNFPFELISDPEEKLCTLFHVVKAKSMFGITFQGIERSTFVIDASSVLVHEWRKVRVKGHVEAVLNFIKQM